MYVEVEDRMHRYKLASLPDLVSHIRIVRSDDADSSSESLAYSALTCSQWPVSVPTAVPSSVPKTMTVS